MEIFGLKRRKDNRKNYWKNDWLEFHPEFRMANFRFESCGYYDERAQVSSSLTTVLSLIGLIISPLFGWIFAVSMLAILLFIPWGMFYLCLPFKSGKQEEDEPAQYGFYFYGEGLKIPDTFVICAGNKTHHFYLPWYYEWVRTSALKVDGNWEHEEKYNGCKSFYDKEKWGGILFSETHLYTYKLSDGGNQKVNAIIKVDEREWRPKWFKWTSLFAKIKKSIDIEFDSEVGEKAGSWKGGVVGCGYDILPGESPVECLRRMEQERIFR